MSYEAKSELVRSQQLKVQELKVTSKEPSLFVDNGADHTFIINEPIDRVLNVVVKDDSANALVHFAAASISIVDSTAYTAGGDLKAIKVSGLASIDANDLVTIKYIVQE